MNEKDFNQVIMTFFQDDTTRAFSVMYGAFKKEGRNIELQAILNELTKAGFLKKTSEGNYRRTEKLMNLLDQTGLSYGGQPWSYYLSKKKGVNYNKLNMIIAIVAIAVSIILAVVL